jgi:glycosyltransferase involved in cell wall biosynthesis
MGRALDLRSLLCTRRIPGSFGGLCVLTDLWRCFCVASRRKIDGGSPGGPRHGLLPGQLHALLFGSLAGRPPLSSMTSNSKIQDLKVAVIHDWITGRRGGEKVLEAILEHFPQADVFTLVHIAGSLPAVEGKHTIFSSWINRWAPFRSAFQLFFPLFNQAIGRFQFEDYDLVVSISHCAAKNVVLPQGLPHICYCLTPARYAWDLFDDYLKHSVGPWLTPLFYLPALVVRGRWRRVDVQRSKGVSHFVAISTLIQKRIKRCYQRPSEILYPPVETKEFGGEMSERGERFLVLSAVRPNKRVLEIVLACKALGFPLDVIGPGAPRSLSELERLGGANLTVHGYLDDQSVINLVSGCRALIHAATEDFGLAPVEAMSAGRPVIGYRHSGLADTVIDSDERRTGVLFEDPSVEGIKLALQRFAELEESINPDHCRDRAAFFSRERFDSGFAELVQRVLRERKE